MMLLTFLHGKLNCVFVNNEIKGKNVDDLWPDLEHRKQFAHAVLKSSFEYNVACFIPICLLLL